MAVVEGHGCAVEGSTGPGQGQWWWCVCTRVLACACKESEEERCHWVVAGSGCGRGRGCTLGARVSEGEARDSAAAVYNSGSSVALATFRVQYLSFFFFFF